MNKNVRQFVTRNDKGLYPLVRLVPSVHDVYKVCTIYFLLVRSRKPTQCTYVHYMYMYTHERNVDGFSDSLCTWKLERGPLSFWLAVQFNPASSSSLSWKQHLNTRACVRPGIEFRFRQSIAYTFEHSNSVVRVSRGPLVIYCHPIRPLPETPLEQGEQARRTVRTKEQGEGRKARKPFDRASCRWEIKSMRTWQGDLYTIYARDTTFTKQPEKAQNPFYARFRTFSLRVTCLYILFYCIGAGILLFTLKICLKYNNGNRLQDTAHFVTKIVPLKIIPGYLQNI